MRKHSPIAFLASAKIWQVLCGPSPAAANIIQDPTFLNPIGTGLNLTPWSDWTDAGITRHAAPSGIPGNYASMPVGADLFQRFPGPGPGTYALTFYVRDEASWSAS